MQINDRQMIKELQVELTLMQDALMLSLGAKEECLDEIAQAYIDALDDSAEYDAQQILDIAKSLRKQRPELFKAQS